MASSWFFILQLTYICICIYALLREVRKSYGILVGNLKVRLLVRSRSVCDTELKWTVNMGSVMRWAGFNWLLIEPSVRSMKAICRHLVSVSLSKMTPLDGVCWCVSDTLSVSIFLNARLHYHIPKFPVEEVTNRNIRLKSTMALENI